MLKFSPETRWVCFWFFFQITNLPISLVRIINSTNRCLPEGGKTHKKLDWNKWHVRIPNFINKYENTVCCRIETSNPQLPEIPWNKLLELQSNEDRTWQTQWVFSFQNGHVQCTVAMQARLACWCQEETRPHLEAWAICKVLNKTPKIITAWVWKCNTQVWKLTLLTLCHTGCRDCAILPLHPEFNHLEALSNQYPFQQPYIKKEVTGQTRP